MAGFTHFQLKNGRNFGPSGTRNPLPRGSPRVSVGWPPPRPPKNFKSGWEIFRSMPKWPENFQFFFLGDTILGLGEGGAPGNFFRFFPGHFCVLRAGEFPEVLVFTLPWVTKRRSDLRGALQKEMELQTLRFSEGSVLQLSTESFDLVLPHYLLKFLAHLAMRVTTWGTCGCHRLHHHTPEGGVPWIAKPFRKPKGLQQVRFPEGIAQPLVS